MVLLELLVKLVALLLHVVEALLEYLVGVRVRVGLITCLTDLAC